MNDVEWTDVTTSRDIVTISKSKQPPRALSIFAGLLPVNKLHQLFHPGLQCLSVAPTNLNNRALEAQLAETLWDLIINASSINHLTLLRASIFKSLKYFLYRTRVSDRLAHLQLYSLDLSIQEAELLLLAKALSFNVTLKNLDINFKGLFLRIVIWAPY